MRDNDCKEYIHTYKSDKPSCNGCKHRYIKHKIISEINEQATQDDCPIYKGDIQEDSYVRLSSVLEIIEKYVIEV